MVLLLEEGNEAGCAEDLAHMRVALDEASKAYSAGEVPVGAVVVNGDGRVIARAYNRRESDSDPTAHAEVLALREAARDGGEWRLQGATLYVTKEPCPMCSGAMVNARLKRLVYGCSDEKGGAARSLYRLLEDPRLNHMVEVTPGVLAEEGRQLLQEFFRKKRL